MRKIPFLLCLFIFCFAVGPVVAEEETPSQRTVAEEASKTKHVLVVEGQEIPYEATAGTLLLKDDEGKAKASLFYVAYTKEDVEDVRERPITFCFNGGPGSSSVWLHLGAFGPRRIALDEEGNPTRPNRVENNPLSLLDVSDLVFIDPVSTGHSREGPGEDAKQFYGVEEDIASVGEFVRLYLTKNHRWGSPKYLAGESYGTLRAAGLAQHLHSAHRIDVDGVILVSAVLNYQTMIQDAGNDLPFLFNLPTLAATAWYHGKLEDDLQKRALSEILKEVEAFALRDYAEVLFRGDALERGKRERAVEQLCRYTALPKEDIERANLRMSRAECCEHLLKEENRKIGVFDTRLKGIYHGRYWASTDADPSANSIFSAFTVALNQYLYDDLKWDKEEEYSVLNFNVNKNWDYGESIGFPKTADDLQAMMERKPTLRVFVASGYYDLATPYFATDYVFNRMGLDPEIRGNVTTKYYEGGHMMYLVPGVDAQLKTDLTAFYKRR